MAPMSAKPVGLALTAVITVLMMAAVATSSVAQTLLVLNKSDATLSIIDPSTGKTTGSVPTGEGPHEIAVSSDGKLAFVANYGSQTPGSTISVIDIAAKKELRKVDVSPLRRPHGLHVAEGKLYFTAEANRLIARYDPASDKIDWLLGTGQVGTHMVSTNSTKDVSQIYTANIGGDSICVFDRAQGQPGQPPNPFAWNVTVVPVGKGPEGFDVSPDVKELWAAHSRDGGVSVIDLATKKVTQTFDAQTKRSNRLKFTPDGKHVLISDLDSGDLVVVDVASKKTLKRVPLGKQPEGILVLPDGGKAYVAVSGDNKLAIIDLKTFDVTGNVTTGASPDGMAWVPKS
jgi:YVTN family beta-propeller protein